MEDLERAGGVYAVMKELADAGLIETDLITCTGKTVAENIKDAENLDHDTIRPIDNPYLATGGIAVLFGNLAPDGCVVKQSAVAPRDDEAFRPRPGVQLRGGGHCGDLCRRHQARRRGGHPL